MAKLGIPNELIRIFQRLNHNPQAKLVFNNAIIGHIFLNTGLR